MKFYPQFPRTGGTAHRATWGNTRVSQEARGDEGEHGQEPLSWLLQEGAGETQQAGSAVIGLASFNHFIGFKVQHPSLDVLCLPW